ncbi:acyltransferase [Paucibacter sp. B2R-40]|uniref:acyltransferase n=1 Tax=Paucibacter sp. B2R-40 TaxID=2893554 RepID=UPI0021E39646|nr:acyltransferase [Paucibacter sp. B2R-40]MCV2354545.1 acyltransferase [Paucibacter sp. B2R-40]
MALLGYKWDALVSRLNARWQSLLGLSAAAGVQVHPASLLRFGPGSSIGERSIVYRGVSILATGSGSFRLGRDSHIGAGGYLLVGGQRLVIGDDVAIGPGLMLFCESNAAAEAGLFRSQYDRADVRIGSNVFIGARVTILPGAEIADHVVIAAHSVVRGVLASGFVYGGCPARALRPLESEGGGA